MNPDSEEFRAIDVHSNGIRFRVHTAGEGDRLALLLHGFPECWYAWRAQIPLFEKLGYRVWAPDLRGYGETERPIGLDAYRAEVLLADIAGLIDAAGAREVVLVGHDWGGAIAWAFALEQIRPIDRLIVCNMPYPPILIEHLRRLGPQFRRSWYMLAFQIPRFPEWYLSRNDGAGFLSIFSKRLDPSAKDLFKRNALEPGALSAMLDYYRAAFQRPLPKMQGKVEIPTLMLWGDRDRAFVNEVTEGTEKYVPDLTLRYLRGASHWVQQDAPEMVNEMIEAWMDEREVPYATHPV